MKLFVGIDGSSAGQAALDLVASVDWPDHSRARIVEVVERDPVPFQPWAVSAYAPAEDVEAELLRAAEKTVAAAARRLRTGPLEVETAVLRGQPSDALLEDARRMGADLIVVGSRGHGTLEAMLLGSVSAEIIARSPVPVLVVRSATATRAMLAWDRSPAARAAAELIERWPLFRGAAVRVASVVDTGPWWAAAPPLVPAEAVAMFEVASDEARAAATASVHEVASNLREMGLAADEVVLEGDSGAALIQAARDWHADLVVMGTHGRRGIARMVLGSVARTLVLHAPTSILVVPTPAVVPAAESGHHAAAAAR